MTLCRVIHNKNNPYLTINTTIATDTRLEWKAKGIWLYAFSRKDDWQFYESDLVKRSADSRTSLRSGLKELEKYGYLYRADQEKDANGKFQKKAWYFFETPKTEEEIKIMFPSSGFVSTVNQSTENRSTENDTLVINDKPIIDEANKENNTSRNSVAMSEHSFRLVDFLFSKMKEGNSKAKPPNREKGAIAIDRMHRLDGYSWDEIEKLIEFAHDDYFWRANILSGEKLREKANQLTMKMKLEIKKASKRGPDEKKRAIWKEAEEYVKEQANILKQKHKYLNDKMKYHDGWCEVWINGVWVRLDYTENGFKEQFLNMLRKGDHI